MSSNRFAPTPDAGADPSWAGDLAKVREVVRRAPPGTALDPAVVAGHTTLPLGVVIALLQVLAGRREGRLELRVLDGRGREVGAYATLGDIPASVHDQFGDIHRVSPEDVELIFRVGP